MRSIRERRADSKYRTSRRNRLLLPWCLLLLCALLGLFDPTPVHAQEPGPTTWEWRTFTSDNSPLAPGEVNALLEDSQGRIWIGTGYHDGATGTYKGGVSVYAAGAWQTFTDENSSLAPGYVTELLEDSQGRIWIGTSEGLSLYQAGAWQTFTAENSPLALGRVSVLLEDSQGRIWIGTGYRDGATGTYKGGASVYAARAWQTFTDENSPLAWGEVWALLEDAQGRIWVRTDGGVSVYAAGAWQTFTNENSPLAPALVSALLGDAQGRMWVGTAGGVNVYAAGVWQTFTNENSPLAPGYVNALLEDAQGHIWVGTGYYGTPKAPSKGGVSVYAAGAWQTFTSEDSPLAPGEVQALLEDAQGRVWVKTDYDMSVYATGSWQTFTSDFPLGWGEALALLEDAQGRIWVGTSGSVSVCTAGVWQTFTDENSPLGRGQVRALLADSQGRMWVGTWDGVSLYQARAWQTFTSETSPLAPGDVNALLEDAQGRIWVGTGFYDAPTATYKGGVSVYEAGAWQTFTAQNSPLAWGGVRALLEDTQGRMWVGTTGGVSVYTAGAWQTFTSEDSPLTPGKVGALLEDAQGRMWVGTDDGVSVYATGTWQTFTAENSPLAWGEVRALLEDTQGRVWVGTDDGVSVYAAGAWQTFTSETSPLAPGDVNALLEDAQGRTWIGTGYYDRLTATYKGGVSVYAAGIWQTFTSENTSLARDWATALLEDSQGRMWVGTGYYDRLSNTSKGGVSVCEAGVWQTFTAEDSPLAPGKVGALLEDSQGRIWVGTGFHDAPTGTYKGGVSVYAAGAWQTLTDEDSPLAWGEVWALLEDSQGRVWVGTGGGLTVRRYGDRPCGFLRYAGPALGQTASLRATNALTFTFSSRRSTLEIGFSGIDAESDSDRLLFRCQLVGHEEEEFPCASPVRYAAVPPGIYTFRVRALDEDLMSSEPATATITLISTALPTLTPTPAPTPTPHIIEVERMVPGLPRETVIPIIGGLGGLVIAAVLGVVIGRQVRRARRLAAWRKGADPYVVGDVIEEPERFYGREEALTELLRALEAGNHVALYGERRIGKTSLLHQLAYRLRNLPQSSVHFLPVFANLQMVSEPRFFSALAEAIAKAARRELEQHKQSLPTLQVDNRREGYDSRDLADDLEVIVEVLQKAIGQSPRIVLLLDEADEMNGYAPHTQGALRGLLMMPVGRRVKLVWSGQAMNREWHLESSPWYNLFKQEIHLGGLEEEAAARLIREPVGGIFTYEDEAVRHILELTGREPYPIQRLCSFCVRRLSGKKNHFRVTADDVEAAWQDMQAEDVRRTAEGATDLTYQSSRPAWAIAEKGTKYHTGKEGEA